MWPLGFHLEMVPFFGFEQAFGVFIVSVRLLLAFGIEPTAHADSINATGFAAVDLALVTLGFAFIANQTKTEARIEPCIFLWNFNLQFYNEIAHLQITDHPDIDL